MTAGWQPVMRDHGSNRDWRCNMEFDRGEMKQRNQHEDRGFPITSREWQPKTRTHHRQKRYVWIDAGHPIVGSTLFVRASHRPEIPCHD